VPTHRWRVELAGLVQGLGVENGSWGFGHRFLRRDAPGEGSTDLSGADSRSFSTTSCGLIAGITVRF
jgi:hypothetical protein